MEASSLRLFFRACARATLIVRLRDPHPGRNTSSPRPTMRAAWYERQGAARDVLLLGHMTDPEPAYGEVRIRLAVRLSTPAMKKRSGWQGAPMRNTRVIPHSDGVGVIDAVGAGLSPNPVSACGVMVRSPIVRSGRRPSWLSYPQGSQCPCHPRRAVQANRTSQSRQHVWELRVS